MDVGVYRLNRSGKRVRSHEHHHLVPLLQTMGFSSSNREPSYPGNGGSEKYINW